MVITKTVDIPDDRRLIIEIPHEIPAGQVILTFTPKAAAYSADTTQEQKKERKRGCLKGLIWMAEDFDAPLEDFKDYM